MRLLFANGGSTLEWNGGISALRHKIYVLPLVERLPTENIKETYFLRPSLGISFLDDSSFKMLRKIGETKIMKYGFHLKF